MNDAESNLGLTISYMTSNFFPWNDPNTNLHNALSWIQAVVSVFLSFIPFVGSLFSEASSPVIGGVIGSTQALTVAGFQELSTGGSDLVLVYIFLAAADLTNPFH